MQPLNPTYRYEVRMLPTSANGDDPVSVGLYPTLAGASNEASYYSRRGAFRAWVIRLADGETLRDFSGSGKPDWLNYQMPLGSDGGLA